MGTKVNTDRYAVTCRICKAHWTATVPPDAPLGLYVTLAVGHKCEKFEASRKRVGDYQLGTIYLMIQPITHNPHGSQHKCGARCRSAKGGACECSCKGLNHGADHAG